jgi:gamma-glutamyl phosphate reductase
VTSCVKIQNYGLVAASFGIKGTGGARGITARYYRGRTNITAAVRAGTYATASLPPRASVVLRVVVRAARSSAAQATFLTTARSQAGTPRDAVRLVARAFG